MGKLPKNKVWGHFPSFSYFLGEVTANIFPIFPISGRRPENPFPAGGQGPSFGCSFFAYSWKLPAYSGDFFLTVDHFSFLTYNSSFFAYSFSFFTYNWSFFAYSGKVHLISALRDCKQRSLTVSKKAPTVSRKASPQFWGGASDVCVSNLFVCFLFFLGLFFWRKITRSGVALD